MNESDQTFGEHLEVLRRMLFRIIIAVVVIAVFLFCFKETLFSVVFAPCDSDFLTFRVIRKIVYAITGSVNLFNEDISLIATDISSQFMIHMSLSIYMGLLFASPYILYEIMKYIAPALYENEKKYAKLIMYSMYFLFIIGLLVSYFLLFPLSCRFLVTYNISPSVTAMPTISSYISLFITLTLIMGLVFELPVVCYMLGKLGLINSMIMSKYRKYAFVLIMFVSAIITPPDIISMVIVSLPLYLLYELSVRIVKQTT
ncbi:MAG: twin-arginine translocase subunit TatC [Prevotella sp.]|nr:twin-arginine translocase subunit TatC [Prevotella sp.]